VSNQFVGKTGHDGLNAANIGPETLGGDHDQGRQLSRWGAQSAWARVGFGFSRVAGRKFAARVKDKLSELNISMNFHKSLAIPCAFLFWEALSPEKIGSASYSPPASFTCEAG
jgi:hypothetical protein